MPYDPTLNQAEVIALEDWAAWLFDRDPDDWERMWDIDGEDCEVGSPENPRWCHDPKLLLDLMIALHEAGPELFNPYTNRQIGKALWSLYSPIMPSPAVCPSAHDCCLLSHHLRLITALPGFIENVAAPRVPPASSEHDSLHVSIYMFWDMIHFGGTRNSAEQQVLEDAIMSELLACMEIDHPLAIAHAIHGFGDLYYFEPPRKPPAIAAIRRWLAKSANSSESWLRAYAENVLSLLEHGYKS